MTDKVLEERVTELEVRISFQDSTIEELNSIVTKQQEQIEKLNRLIDELKGQLENPGEIDKTDVKPPHY
jgi:SlyX protein